MSIPNQQWKYLIICEAYDTRGTDDDKVALAAAEGEDLVIELATCKVLSVNGQGGLTGKSIEEQTWFKFD